MTKKIDQNPVVAGRIIRVYNTKRRLFSNANKVYYSIQVEDADGGNERCLLFTENELKRASYRSSRNKEDLTKKGWLTNLLD